MLFDFVVNLGGKPNFRHVVRDSHPELRVQVDTACVTCDQVVSFLRQHEEAGRLDMVIVDSLSGATDRPEHHHHIQYDDVFLPDVVHSITSVDNLGMDLGEDAEEHDGETQMAVSTLLTEQFYGESTTLLHHQQHLVDYYAHDNWSVRRPPVLLYWSMGSGKTLGILNALSNSAMSPPRVTVVCPNSIIDYWVENILRTPSTSPGRTHYRVLGYAEFHRQCDENEDFLGPEDVVILDEAHHYKNLTPNMRIDLEVIAKAAATFLLTGTPVLNSTKDLRGLCLMLRVPERTPIDELTALLQGRVFYYDPVVHNPLQLQNHFPHVRRGITNVPMTWKQTVEYVMCAAQTVTIGNVTVQSSKSNSYDALTRVVSNAPKIGGKSPKFRAVVKNIVGLNKYPQVVYSHYRQHGVDGIRQLLSKRQPQLRIQTVTGSTGVRTRKCVVDAYNSGQVDVLMITDAAKEGIDLHGTAVLHMLESHVNTQSEFQTMTRVVRYDSHQAHDRSVLVIKYISTFPTQAPTQEELVDLQEFFCTEYLRRGDLEFPLLENLLAVIRDEHENHTVDQRYELNNVSKQTTVDPCLKAIQAASTSPLPDTAR